MDERSTQPHESQLTRGQKLFVAVIGVMALVSLGQCGGEPRTETTTARGVAEQTQPPSGGVSNAEWAARVKPSAERVEAALGAVGEAETPSQARARCGEVELAAQAALQDVDPIPAQLSRAGSLYSAALAEFLQGGRLCSQGEFEAAVPHVERGTAYLEETTEELNDAV